MSTEKWPSVAFRASGKWTTVAVGGREMETDVKFVPVEPGHWIVKFDGHHWEDAFTDEHPDGPPQLLAAGIPFEPGDDKYRDYIVFPSLEDAFRAVIATGCRYHEVPPYRLPVNQED